MEQKHRKTIGYPGKRLLDIMGASIGLILGLPVFIVIAILVRFFMGTPVIFRQVRPGWREKPFTLLKFRTMTDGRDKSGNLLPDGMRLTKLGIFLRKSSLDELPELWNVLRGDMSLVGPRPLLMQYLPYYSERERIRFRVRPGITGIAQTSGRNYLKWDKRLELDVKYVENINVVQDIGILFRTVVRSILGSGVSADTDDVEPFLDVSRQEGQK